MTINQVVYPIHHWETDMDELYEENETESYFKEHVFDFPDNFHQCQQK